MASANPSVNFHNTNLSRFLWALWLTLAVFIGTALFFTYYVFAEKQIDRANELRQQSFLLADELRQSSDDLTRMVRSYVLTGNPRYKQHYQEIIAIRDGVVARPLNYQEVYWDLVLDDDQRPRAHGEKIALLELMRQAGITDVEFAKLAEAKANSDALTQTEYSAMQLLESTTLPNDANRLTAGLMLEDANYYQAKAAIMRPIGEFNQMMDQRTLKTVQRAQQIARSLRMVVVAFGLLLVFLIWYAYRMLHVSLGGSLEELYRMITRLGSGDFSAAVTRSIIVPNSVLSWVAETQNKLALLDQQRQVAEGKNHRLTQLYAALSQCNQAIVRCTSQQELFAMICRDAVIFGGMKMVWIGMLDAADEFIVPVAAYGSGTEYLDGIRISQNANAAHGRGPTGAAMRDDQPVWCQDFQHDAATSAWHERAANYHWGASASLPLHRNGGVVGALTFYATEVNAFDEAVQDLLLEMVMDIDFALCNFDREEQRKLAEQDLAHSHKLLKTIIDTAPVRIFWKSKDFRYLGCNPVFAADVGVAAPSDLIGKDDFQLIWPERAELYRADDLQVVQTGRAKLFYQESIITPSGNTLWVRASKVPLHNERDGIIGILGIYEDITAQKQADERIQYLANYDALTGLPNRTWLNEHVLDAIQQAKDTQAQLALMFLDLDHFKDINDTLGHSIGDALLVELAQRLQMLLGAQDMVTRLGGDEFILLLLNTDMQEASAMAESLLATIALPYQIEHFNLVLTASIGIALYPADGTDLEALSKSADAAMYRVKHEGRQGYRFFTPEMQARSARNLQLLTALRQALVKQELFLHFQPQVAMQDGRIIGAEALLRWQHPEMGLVSPGEFISIAEDSGLILPIGEWVLRQAVRQAKRWRQDRSSTFVMAVNLSVVQFRQPDLPELVSRILQEEDFPAHCLELELTESVAMHNPQGAIAVMHNLHARGIKMSIDDFGTGYSSLNYLKKFKVYKLKIDQSFVRDIGTEAEDKALVRAIINMANSLGLKTIAEGVETVEQLEFLRQAGCDELQGYLFSKPVPTQQFADLLQQGFFRQP